MPGRKIETQAFDSIVAGIYAAASGRDSWGTALDRTSAGLNAWGVQLIGVDKRNGSLQFTHDGGAVSPQAALDYIRTYHHVNPRIAPTLAMGPNDWFHDHEHFDAGFVAASPFYQDFLIPHGGRYVSGTKIVEDDNGLVIFGAMRSARQTPFGNDERAVLQRLKGHLFEALAIQSFVKNERSQHKIGYALLNQFTRPMILIDAERTIQFANEAAQQTLRAGEYLVTRGWVLHCREAEADQALATALYELRLMEGLTHSSPPPDRRFVKTKAKSDGRPIGIYLSAVRPDLTMRTFGSAPQALVFLHDPKSAPGFDSMVIAETFGLTPAEADVAIEIASGNTVERIAANRSVSVSTVRTQLAAVFSKTETTRQSDLVRVLAAMPEFRQ